MAQTEQDGRKQIPAEDMRLCLGATVSDPLIPYQGLAAQALPPKFTRLQAPGHTSAGCILPALGCK